MASRLSNGEGSSVNGTNGMNGHHAIPDDDAIAIIGMSCQFPGEAEDSEKLWRLLMESRSAASEFPASKMNINAHYHPDPAHIATTHVKGGHFLKHDGRAFDAPFFSLTKTEVMSMDTQQRIVMESVYEALENSGISIEQVTSTPTSVFIGAFNSDYKNMLIKDPDIQLKYMPTGTSNSIMSNRVSWFYDLRGCSLTLDTACSSSAVAFHLACGNLREKDGSTMSIVSGVNIIDDPTSMYRMSNIGFLSPDGRSYSFDHRANGYSRGEGVGTVILKKLKDAIRDGNTIRAVVRATGINQDGRTPGITLPSKAAQENLIKTVYQSAGLDPSDTGFVEAHGTGTAMGDPIEAGALAAGFAGRDSSNPLYVGAIKSNIGHLEGGAGVAGLIKSIMILEKGIIPPNIGFEKCNPKIPAKEWNLAFPTSPVAWPTKGLRRISVNSFGFGGTNAHIVLDDAYHYLQSRHLEGNHRTLTDVPTLKYTNGVEPLPENPICRVFVWSASDEAGVRRALETYLIYLESISQIKNEAAFLDDLAYTLGTKRSLFPWKSFIVAASLSQLMSQITSRIGIASAGAVRSKATPKLGFVFTGQGAQWFAMGRGLLTYPTFRRSLEEANQYLKELSCEWDLCDEFLKDANNSKINSPSISQTLCTVLQVALVDLMNAWNVKPARVVGHSSGEIAAAYAVGGISRESAWKIAYFRGLVSEQVTKKGAMLAVGSGESGILPYIRKINSEMEGELMIACFNSPKSLTVSGDESKVDALKKVLEADSIFARKLKVMNAYHSSHMREVAGEYLRLMGDLSTSPTESSHDMETLSQPAMFSSVTGSQIAVSELGKGEYWVDNMVSQVKFTQALSEMCSPTTAQKRQRMGRAGDMQLQGLLEVGPHPALQNAVKETLSAVQLPSITYSYLLTRNNDAVYSALEAIGGLFCQGFQVDLNAVNHNSHYESAIVSKPNMLTDLPSYSFNHTQEYWPETRYSKDFRFRKHPRHDLLGARVNDWNPSEPKWKHVVRLSELPWLHDHEITGVILYPGVGFLIMAIEASKQMAEPDVQITGYHFRDISIKTALQIPDAEDGIETMISMRPTTESATSSSSIWREFKITSYNPETGSWTEHCRGLISLETKTDTGPIDNGREAESRKQMFKGLLKHAEDACTSPLDMGNLYMELRTIGLKFGPLFRAIDNVTYGGHRSGEALATVTVPDVRQVMPSNFMEPHVIHPATMDAMVQMFLAAVYHATGRDKVAEPFVPIFMQDVWLSALISNQPGHKFRGHGAARKLSQTKLGAEITIWDADTGLGQMTVRGMQAVALQSSTNEQGTAKQLCYNMCWKPDVDLLEAQQAVQYFANEVDKIAGDDPEVLRKTQDLQLATLIYIKNAVEDLDKTPLEKPLHSYHEKFLVWMRHHISEYEKGAMQHSSSGWETVLADPDRKADVLKKASVETADGQLLARMGEQIIPIMRQQADALEIMFHDDLPSAFYSEMLGIKRTHELLAAYLKSLSHKRVNLRVLEVGAGTGSISRPILKTLSPEDDDNSAGEISKLSSYMYTDISPSFFDAARTKFKAWKNVLDFKTLDLEVDPTSQGFEEGTYDIVVASNVLHATADLNKTVGNIRRLMKPGGKLILHEVTESTILRGPMCFGLLPGWWLSVEPNRQMGPTLSQKGWDDMLHDHNFNGNELILPDTQRADCHVQSLIISTAMERSVAKVDIPETLVLVSPSSEESQATGLMLESALTARGVPKVSVITFDKIKDHNLKSSVCVVLSELEGPILQEMDEAEMEDVRHLLTTTSGLLWLTKDIRKTPEVGLISGLLRSIRWERDLDESNLITLSFEDAELRSEEAIRQVTKIYSYHFLNKNDQRHAEYKIVNGILEINRLVNADYLNDFLHSQITKPTSQLKPFGEQKSRSLTLSVRAPGLLDTLEFVDFPVKAELEPHEVEVQIKATGLNFRDVMVAMGEISDRMLGLEASGIVTKVGSAVTSFKVDDRVMLLSVNSGCFQTHVRTSELLTTRIPDSMSFEEAAGIPVIFGTAYFCLVDAARLRKGESILIHAASGGVGQAAMMIAQHLEAEIFVTVSSEDKRKIVIENYGIPQDHIFSSRGLSFANSIMAATNGRGVDVILNSLSGEALRRSWDCIAPFGRFIEIGKKDVYANSKLDMFAFSKSATFAACDLNLVIHLDQKTGARLLRESLRLWREGVIRPTTPYNVYNYGQIEDAFRFMQAGKHIGKVVLKADSTDMVKVVPELRSPHEFSADASYILAGGLGGIGRSVARWMVSRGARHLIFLSRSGDSTAGVKESTSQAVKELLDEMRVKKIDCSIYKVDIGDPEKLKEVLDECTAKMPPIKGCIQGAMQLKDIAFENMTLADLKTTLRPKVQGSWNLHELLPEKMDFFIMLSSIAGIIGNRGQSNYAAGNTYQDALARYRLSRGLPAVSLDLGNILSVGYIAENKDDFTAYDRLALSQDVVKESELLSIIEYHTDPRNHPVTATQLHAQVPMGLVTSASFAQKGIPEPTYMSFPLFTQMRALSSNTGSSSDDSAGPSIASLLASVTNVDDATTAITTALIRRLSITLAIPVDDIDSGKPVHHYGVDSLVAIEFRNWFAKDMGADIPVLDITGTNSIAALSRKIATVSKNVKYDEKPKE